ncbi:3-dehydroquinate synthase [Thermaurantiacus sp.]
MRPAERVRVDLGARGYDILIGPGLMRQLGSRVLDLTPARRLPIVTDSHVAGHHLPPLVASFEAAGLEPAPIILPPGEGSKDFATLQHLVSELLALDVSRKGLVLALGGGVIGDLAGFAAAILKRGVPFLQLPTTLLAMVDSSVGGKTAINVPAGKNLVGAFHQPAMVIADTDVLATLPDREMRAGYAEVVKYGLLGDAAFFAWLEAHGAGVLARSPPDLARAIATSVRAKARIVEQDEQETGDIRALLNLGHTFGHALEAETGFSDRLLHGEAVAIGMAQAFRFSARLGLCSTDDARRVEAHLAARGLATRLPLPAESLLRHMLHDKKRDERGLPFILVRGIGQAFVARDVPLQAVRAFLEAEERAA